MMKVGELMGMRVCVQERRWESKGLGLGIRPR